METGEEIVSLYVELDGNKTTLTLNEVPSDLETIQRLVIDHIKNESLEVSFAEQFSLLVNKGKDGDDINSFSQLSDFSNIFSDINWWKQITLRVISHENEIKMTDNDQKKVTVQYFGEELKLNEYEFAINRSHTQKEILEICQIVDLSEVSSDRLMDIFTETSIASEEIDMWAGYNDSGKIFNGNKETAKIFLKNIIDYCERSSSTSQNIKEKLRMITKLLDHNDAATQYNVPQLLLYLASHGSACNVLKEVAVDMTYSLMTDSVEEFLQQQSIENTILRHLRDLRYNIVEELYSSFGATNNIHGIAMLNNHLATVVDGIPIIVDPNISNWGLPSGWQDGLADKFWEKYTSERCLNCIVSQINEKRLPYQQIVTWFEARSPNDIEKYEFLSRVFDAETGIIDRDYLSWMLSQMNIFNMVKMNQQNAQEPQTEIQTEIQLN